MEQRQKKKPLVTRKTPPITRTSSRTESQMSRTTASPLSQTNKPTTTPINPPPTNESETGTSMVTGDETPNDHLTPTPSEELMDIQLLSSSFENLDLDGILDEIIEGTSDILGDLEDTQAQNKEHEDELLDKITEKGKRWKAYLIILAKANHHKNFMETCLKNKNPPKSMSLWCKPHIYHSNSDVEREWKDTLQTASLKLVSILVRHHTRIIRKEKQTMQEAMLKVNTIIQAVTESETKQLLLHTWSTMKKQATEEAKTLSESLRASRESKLAPRKRKRSVYDEHKDFPEIPRKNSRLEDEQMKAMAKFFELYQKNESAPRQPDRSSYRQDRRAPTHRDRYQGRGKEPDSERDYPRKH